MIYYNTDYETWEYTYPDGFILIFRDKQEAEKFAKEHGLEVNHEG